MSVGKCRLVKVDRPRPNEVDLGMFLLPCLHSNIGMQGFVLKESSGATWLMSFVVSLWQGSITDEYLQVDPWTEERAGFDDQANGRRRDSTVESRGVPWTPPSNLIPILSNFWRAMSLQVRQTRVKTIGAMSRAMGKDFCCYLGGQRRDWEWSSVELAFYSSSSFFKLVKYAFMFCDLRRELRKASAEDDRDHGNGV
ncbi:hypothetical protein K438DRAFT_1948418 [Mycena galopus ATCC 62051]|nr:hypothetical protein K438DRAFT_1948418 [Mycena galopus ATCC 62051]